MYGQNFYPATYPGGYPGYQPYPVPPSPQNSFQQNQPVQNQQTSPPVQQPPQQAPVMQENGFIRVPNEEAARQYPVQLGTSQTFADERLPVFYVKTMGQSVFDAPKFEKYQLVKMEEHNNQHDSANIETRHESTAENMKSAYDDLSARYEELKFDIDLLKEQFGEFKKQEVK